MKLLILEVVTNSHLELYKPHSVNFRNASIPASYSIHILFLFLLKTWVKTAVTTYQPNTTQPTPLFYRSIH